MQLNFRSKFILKMFIFTAFTNENAYAYGPNYQNFDSSTYGKTNFIEP